MFKLPGSSFHSATVRMGRGGILAPPWPGACVFCKPKVLRGHRRPWKWLRPWLVGPRQVGGLLPPSAPCRVGLDSVRGTCLAVAVMPGRDGWHHSRAPTPTCWPFCTHWVLRQDWGHREHRATQELSGSIPGWGQPGRAWDSSRVGSAVALKRCPRPDPWNL